MIVLLKILQIDLKNDVFEVQAYSWNEDNPTSYNFKYYVGKESNLKDIEIS